MPPSKLAWPLPDTDAIVAGMIASTRMWSYLFVRGATSYEEPDETSPDAANTVTLEASFCTRPRNAIQSDVME